MTRSVDSNGNGTESHVPVVVGADSTHAELFTFWPTVRVRCIRFMGVHALKIRGVGHLEPSYSRRGVFRDDPPPPIPCTYDQIVPAD